MSRYAKLTLSAAQCRAECAPKFRSAESLSGLRFGKPFPAVQIRTMKPRVMLSTASSGGDGPLRSFTGGWRSESQESAKANSSRMAISFSLADFATSSINPSPTFLSDKSQLSGASILSISLRNLCSSGNSSIALR